MTGGEATINKDFYNVVDIVSKYDSFLVVNTNGANLKTAYDKGYGDKFDSIALSRHHYDDKLNDEILGFKSLTRDELKEMNFKNIHFSCNLQKNYINNEEKFINI